MTAAREHASALMRLTLVEACEAVRKGEVTSVALTEVALGAFKAGDPTINASIALEPEEALQTAERLDRLQGRPAARPPPTACPSRTRTCTTGRANLAGVVPRFASHSGRPI